MVSVIKTHSQYVCQQCGYSQVGWAGKCPNCGAWGSLVETIIETTKAGKTSEGIKPGAKLVSLSSVPSKSTTRISTKISELDRVLGGGLVPGQVVLIAGEPGIGKSTLLLELADRLSNILYICGEESAGQIAIRAKRLGVTNRKLKFLEETDVDSALSAIEGFPEGNAIIVDSIQTMTTDELSGLAGSVGQVRESAFRLLRAAKEKNIPLLMVGHVTKEGSVAGPAVLAHMVDTLLWFEGDTTSTLRVLRAVKNRFGPTDEVGIFAMEEAGLIPQDDPEKLFLTRGKNPVAGCVISSVREGTRPILVEIQSLVIPSKLAFPKRVSQGIDPKRFELLLAVVSRRANLPLYENDCFINVAGGIKVNETACDLAVCLSLASAYFDKALPAGSVAIGEVGLLGEVREVTAQEKRVKEARRLGYTKPITNKEFRFIGEAVRRLFVANRLRS